MWRAMKPRAPKWIVDAGNRPCPGRRVHAPGDQQVWVCRAERHAVHVVRVTNECLDALPSFNVPDLCRLVVASGGEQGRASRAESDAAYSICVFFQRLDAFNTYVHVNIQDIARNRTVQSGSSVCNPFFRGMEGCTVTAVALRVVRVRVKG